MAAKRKKTPAKSVKKTLDRDSPRWVHGIHDYCDGWCERCDYSHRCFKFASIEQSFGEGSATKKNNTQSVLDALGRMLAQISQEIDRSAKNLHHGDEEKIVAQIAAEKRLFRRALTVGSRETKAALTYALIVDEWFNNELGIPLRYIRSLEKRVQTGLLRTSEAKGDLVRINDSVEVIRWHQHLPYIKLCRAFTSLVEESSASKQNLLLPKNKPTRSPLDSDGSAKVALISADQSIDAWSQLQEIFPEATDTILPILLHLDRLRRITERRFPRARKFKRPGFDEKSIKKNIKAD